MRWSLLLFAVVLGGCAKGSELSCRCGTGDLCAETRCQPYDGGVDAGPSVDAGPFVDAGSPVDAAIAMDSGAMDAALPDAGPGPVDAGPPPDVPGCPDGDRDGHADAACGGTDCDDRDARVRPGAEELCDGIDQDCDGRIDEGSFSAFFVGAGSSTWRRYELECVSPSAPVEPVQTVFDIESLSRAYFLTATTYHVLDLTTRTWIGNGARSAIMPAANGKTFIAAHSTPAAHSAMWGGSPTVETVNLLTATQAYVYDVDFANPSAPTFRLATLSGGRTNPVDLMALPGLETGYQDTTGSWAPDPRAACPEATYTAGPYAAYFTRNDVQLIDLGICFAPITTVPIASFGPFTSPSAPLRSAWRHAVYNAGLWLFAAPRLP